jgi:hypothetical protein
MKNWMKRKTSWNRKFTELDLFVNGKEIELKEFSFIKGTHYHEDNNRLYLDCKLDVFAKWEKDHKPKHTELDIAFKDGWDGASIPKFIQWLIGDPLSPEFALASAVHDFAVDQGLDHYIESRIFYEILKTRKGKMNLPWWKEKAMYIAVFGWSIYTA